MEKAVFLGHALSSDGVAVDPENVEAISQWKKAKNVTEVRSFLRMAGYFHRLIDNFQKITKPMIELLKNDVPLVWSDKCEFSF